MWQWASTGAGTEPDIVLAAAGYIPTLEIVAAAWLLCQHLPDLTVRVVNAALPTTETPRHALRRGDTDYPLAHIVSCRWYNAVGF